MFSVKLCDRSRVWHFTFCLQLHIRASYFVTLVEEEHFLDAAVLGL